MPKNPPKFLLITEDFPSGLNGNSVKTRNTLLYLLKKGYFVDVCCSHFDGFKIHGLKHEKLKVFTSLVARPKKKSFVYLSYVLKIIFSVAPITIRRLYNQSLAEKISKLVKKNSYQAIFYDGYSTLQYLGSEQAKQKIYIDDEDFTDLFKQRFTLEKNWFKKFYYFEEYVKSLFFESKKMREVNQIWAISPNTKERLGRVSGVKTVLMPTIMPAQKNYYSGLGHGLMFTGTLNWRENVEGLTWFLEEHWPYVLSKLPNLTLTVIGQGATKPFAQFLSQQKNVVYLGYTADLSSEYKKTMLAISPVRINAGIKVKTLTYLSFGLPVVSSIVAAWGLVSNLGVVLASDKNFGRIVVKVASNSRLLKFLSKQARQNIKLNYAEKRLGDFLVKNLP